MDPSVQAKKVPLLCYNLNVFPHNCKNILKLSCGFGVFVLVFFFVLLLLLS